ncbi:hypothetical protein CR513_10406, partial [Mucuna pruriens]
MEVMKNQDTSLDLTSTSSFSTHMPIFNDENEKFVQYLDLAFPEKRQKGKDIQAKNPYPHILSCRGYKALYKKLVAKKFKEAKSKGVEIEASLVDVAHHELWKRAQPKSLSNYTFDSSKKVIEKINLHVMHPPQQLSLRNILMGKIQPESREYLDPKGTSWPRRSGPGQTSWPRSTSATKNTPAYKETSRTGRLKVVRGDRLACQRTLVDPILNVSTIIGELSPSFQGRTLTPISRNQCALYLDEEDPYLVAIGKVYRLGSTIHHQMLDEDHIRVVVEQI